jgi:tRNA-splicing endonuclease subunit Sen54
LVERGALVLLDDKDEAIAMEYIYEMIAGGNYGCCWNAFQAYKHLKSLGYIVGRYGVPWTMKHSDTCDSVPAPNNMISTNWDFSTADGTCNDITNWLKKMHIDGTSPCFQVYLPNSKFKKSSSGVPSFLICLLRYHSSFTSHPNIILLLHFQLV